MSGWLSTLALAPAKAGPGAKWLAELLAKQPDDILVLVIRVLITLVVGLALARLLAGLAARIAARRGSAQGVMITRRFVFYGLLALTTFAVLEALGVELSVLLGAAGILTVALGFASQTSASNVISGLFLLGERPFSVGDVIRVGETSGEVLSVDLLSVKLRTFDNLYVRVPNETIIKTEVVNLTHYPIRRFDMQVGVAYKEDLERVEEVLRAVAERNPLCLIDPEPLIIILGFGNSSIDLQFSVWAQREKWLEMRNSMHREVKQAFDREGIEIPFPHVSLYAGSATGPHPVRIERGAGPAGPGEPGEPGV